MPRNPVSKDNRCRASNPFCTGRTDDRHACPFQADIYDDDNEDYCDCCTSCTNECADDV